MSGPETPTDPVELQSEIAQTREDLGNTVQALAAKTDVKGRAKNAAGQTAKKAANARDQAVDKAAAVRDQAVDKATAVRDQAVDKATAVRDQATSVRDSAVDKAAVVRDQAVDKASELRDQAAVVAGKVSDKVSDQVASAKRSLDESDLPAKVRKPLPLAVIGAVAGLVGAIIYLVRRRR